MPLLLSGRYLTVGLLGEGGFGAAFLARDRLTPKIRPCVVKQFKPAGNLSAEQKKLAHNLFEKEAEVLDQLGLESPHIPDLFAFFDLDIPNALTGQTDRLFYIVQEFIDGETLEEEWIQGQQLSEADLIEMLNQLLPVLSFIHSHNVIHRDIKPSNIMRHKNGRFYLLDFGAIRDATKSGAKTSTGIYSLGYAPPEQMAGQEIFFSSDLYALAATSVVLATGKEPRELLDSVMNQWNWSQHCGISPQLGVILDKMLAPDPQKRFWSANDALKGLQLATGVSSTTSHIHRIPGNTQLQTPLPSPSAPVTVAPAPLPSLPVNPAPPQPLAAPATPPRRQFALGEYLTGAMFTGFESALLAIGIYHLPLPIIAKALLWLGCGGVLIFLQSRRIIERVDLAILAVITLVVVGLLVRPNLELLALLLLGGMCLGVAIASLFRLVYQLLSKIL